MKMSISKIKLIINIVTLAIIVVVAYFFLTSEETDIGDIWNRILGIAWWMLVLQIFVQFAHFAMVAHFYNACFTNMKMTARKFKLSEMYRFALEMSMVSQVYPGAGISGFSYVHLRLKNLGVKFADTTLVHGLRFIMTYVTFLVILFAGLVALAIGGQVNHLILLFSTLILVGVLAVTGIFIYMVSNQSRIQAFVGWLPKVINYVMRKLHRRKPQEFIKLKKVDRVLGEFHQSYKRIAAQPASLKTPLLFALALNVFDILAIYLAFIALGVSVNPGTLILAYAVANLAGVIAIWPGSVGSYEALMISVLQGLGVAHSPATAGTLVPRVLKLGIFIPLGYLFYYHAINRQNIKLSFQPTKKLKVRKNRQKNVSKDKKL